ncbi:AP-1 adaptor complex sigma subunit Aps1 [Staphylotrichum longicolle]|uniref:AP-1 complex subunit sigma-1 n=2 Tax=Chaetomiaceae TaxID=35718 RepID=A0AAD4EWA7_9PEZI|nr:AP-1 adaptor complex sigma subunit Aps1 [Staphylotrichum longicolle]
MVVVCPSKSQHPHYWARAPEFVPQAFIGKSRGQPLNLQQFDHSFRSLRTCITQQSAAGEAESLHYGNQVCHVFYLPAILEANWDLVSYLILLSRQGKVRLAKWFTTLSPKDKAKIVKDVSQLVLARRTRMCNFLEYKDTKIVYRRYASLFFIAGCSSEDNELITLEIIHRYVEQMDKYYGNVCELDIIFSFTKAYYILDELLLAGELQESSKKNVLRCISQQDALEDMEVEDEVTKIM